MSGRFRRVVDPETGIAFMFKYDVGHPDHPHIFVRHAMTPADAILAWKAGERRRNEVHRRWESRTTTAGEYWDWMADGVTVLVISCFPIGGGRWTTP